MTGTDEQSPWPALWAMIFGFFMILVDSTIVSVAVPALMRDLDADLSAVIWVTSAYLLTYAVPLLVTGRLGDRFGPRTIYLAGLALFTVASAACGLSTTIGQLIAARAVQGLGASMLTPLTMAVITRTFPPDRRGAAMGLWGSVAGAAILVGPILGGVLVDTLGWQWVFFVNVPIGLLALVVGARLIPRLPTHPHRFDLLGVVLSGVAMFCLVFGLEEGGNYDWGTIVGPVSIGSLLIVGVLVLGVFLFWQHRNPAEPLVPLGLFADRNFCAAVAGVLVMGFVATAMGFPMVIYAQVARGLSPTESALLLLPLAVLTGAVSPLVGRYLNTHSPRPVAIAGFSLLAVGMGGYAALMRPEVSVLWLLIPSGVMGVANAGIWGPLSVSATRNLPPQRAGAGAGVYNTLRQVGAVLGSAAIAAFMQQRVEALLPAMSAGPAAAMGTGLPSVLAAPFSTAMSQSLGLPAAVALLGVVAAALLIWRPAPVHRQ
jgi:EmrB/QacA subfamily drug resistance transporter